MLRLLATASVADAASARQTDAGAELLVTDGGPAVPRTCYAAQKLPTYARGTYLIGGPAQFDVGEYHYQGIFDGLGKVNRFELREGEICYTSAWLNTGMYQAAMKAQKEGKPPRGLLFEGTVPTRPACPLLNPLCDLVAANDNNWVNMIPVGRELLLLSDTPTMVRMDLETLSCLGLKAWSDDTTPPMGPPSPNWVSAMHVGTMGSAHPLLRPGSSTYVEVMDEIATVPVLTKPKVDIYTFEASAVGPQARRKIASVEADGTRYFHSFGVTPNYVVLFFNFKLSLTTDPYLLDAFRGAWDGIRVVDANGGVQAFETEPFYHVHIVNSFENASGVVVDLGAYGEPPFAKTAALDRALFLNKTARDSQRARATVRRLHMHLAGPLKGQVTFEDLLPRGRSVDFFQVSPERRGLPYCVYYAVEWWHDDASYLSEAILKHDVCRGARSYWGRPDTYVGEPFFIGSGGPGAEEDDGLLVFVALDGQRRRSRLVALDARSLREVAEVELPGHIPFTAHGQYIPAGAASSRAAAYV